MCNSGDGILSARDPMDEHQDHRCRGLVTTHQRSILDEIVGLSLL
jgi:hypothetical protein